MYDLVEAKKIFDDVYHRLDGYGIAFSSKQRKNSDDKAFVYGEIVFDTYFQILVDALSLGDYKVFYDFGSGIGKPVIASYLLADFQKLVGIEMLSDLHISALYALERLKKVEDINVPIIFVKGDFFTYDCSDADLIFIQSTCFSSEMMEKLSKKFYNLKPGTLVLTASSYLPSGFELIGRKKYKMSWGETTIYFNKK